MGISTKVQCRVLQGLGTLFDMLTVLLDGFARGSSLVANSAAKKQRHNNSYREDDKRKNKQPITHKATESCKARCVSKARGKIDAVANVTQCVRKLFSGQI
ncbi:hypothetical protein TW778 [Tropheryma whipplei TW08/27]|nr:hypothetical protein TW778 [Tropheryma whipplei TW08/27]